MSKLPLISIGLCTYNGAAFLREQLNSLVNQSYAPLEIRIRDDQSTDDTVNIIHEFQRNYPFIHLIQNRERLGFQRNFEAVLQDCTGEYIAPCDQDDIWRTDKLAVLFPLLENHRLVYHDSELIDEKGDSLAFRMSDKFRLSSWNQQASFLLFNCVSGHAMLFHKSLLHSALPFPQTEYYDHWLAWVALETGTIGYTPEPLVKYRQHQDNQTDVIGMKVKLSGIERAKSRIARENRWLKTCKEFKEKSDPTHPSIRFQGLATKREQAYFNFRFGLEIWKNRDQILQIPHYSFLDKLIFSLRYSIGLKTKKLFYSSK